jgi:multidrug/hemolysin transport system permease protein
MLKAMVLRNIKLYFKDKGMFFTSLITPAILLVLYATFLGSVYRDSFTANLPDGFSLSQKLIDGAVGAQLISSIFAVSCVTVPFCSNMLMVQDKITGARKDLTISPVSSAVLSGSYFLGAAISSLLVCFAALALCLGYVRTIGWFFSGKDILLLSADIVLLVLFGTALSSLIHFFLSTQGQISAVGTLVSAGYGFLCGAYMPISSYGSGLQKVLSFLPSTYMTSLVRNHAMRGVLAQMETDGVPKALVDAIRESLDCTVKFAGKTVTVPAMYAYIGGAVLVLLGAYLAVHYLAERKRVHS